VIGGRQSRRNLGPGFWFYLLLSLATWSWSRAEEPSIASTRIAALDRTIMIRTGADGKTYGENEVDPLLWSSSKYFLSGESRARLLRALAAVSSLADAELGRCAPAQRALVQNRVWTVFDHVRMHTGGRSQVDRDYLKAMATAMVKLALDEREIASIPDPLALAAASGQWPAAPTGTGGADIFLPPDIVTAKGRWEELVRERGEPIAPNHVSQSGGRSLFSLLARFPDGATPPRDYFKAVTEFPLPWVRDEIFGARLSPDLPPLPVGAEFALIRRLAVVGRDGLWHATPLTLTIQLRHYRVTTREAFETLRATESDTFRMRLQSFAEFELETTGIAEGRSGRMRAVGPGDKKFMVFFSHGIDQVGGMPGRALDFQVGPSFGRMKMCANCHAGIGLGSINTLLFPTGAMPLSSLVSPDEKRESAAGAHWKESRVEWGTLQAFWAVASSH
jgi:hypothetical protein